MTQLNPREFMITRKRKKYKFALFYNNPLCFEADTWKKGYTPSVLEMGAGTGLFSVELAEKSPSVQYVAVDVKADRLQTGARVATEKNLENIRFLRARADQLPELLKPNSLQSIWITFPDPFPKERSAKHRLTHPALLDMYQTFLSRDGALYFKTDAKLLFEWSLEQLVAKGWRTSELSFDLHESDLPAIYKIKTTYEQRFTSEGLPIYFVRAEPDR